MSRLQFTERALDHGQGKADILTDTDVPRHQGSDSHTGQCMDHKDLTRAGQGGMGLWSSSPQDKVGTVETESGAATKRSAWQAELGIQKCGTTFSAQN